MQVPAEVAAALIADGLAVGDAPAGGSDLGALPDAAEYAAFFLGQAAALVTLVDAPRVLRTVARGLVRHHRDRTFWLHARGPGGEVTLDMGVGLDEAVLTGLLAALWRVEGRPDDDTAPGA